MKTLTPLLLVLAACNVDSELRATGSFERVALQDGMALAIHDKADLEDDELFIFCRGELATDIRTEVEDDTLILRSDAGVDATKCTIEFHDGAASEFAIDTDDSVVIDIDGREDVHFEHIRTAGDLELHLRGSSRIVIDEADAGDVAIDQRGQAGLEIGTADFVHVTGRHDGRTRFDGHDIETDRWTLESRGNAQLTADGTTTVLEIDARGNSEVLFEDLEAEEATVEASGSTTVTVFVDSELALDASGNAEVDVFGNPLDLDVDVTGSADVAGL